MTEPSTSNVKRILIRNWVKARLIAAQIVAQGHVYDSRAKRIWPKEMPAILIYTKPEIVELVIKAPKRYKRRLSIFVEIFIRENESTLDDSLDILATKVENALLIFGQEPTGYFTNIDLKSSDATYIQDGDNGHGSAVLEFEAEYFTDHLSDLTELKDFTKYQTTIEPSPAGEERPLVETKTQFPPPPEEDE